MVMALLLLKSLQDLFRQGFTTFTTFCPYLRQGEFTASVLTEFFDKCVFRRCICHKGVQCHDYRNAKLLQVFNMFLQVYDTLFQCFQVLCSQVCFRHSAIVLQCTDSRNQYDCVRMKICFPALDIHKFLSAKVCAEACFGDYNIRQLQGCLCGTDAVAAMCYIRKWSAMYQSTSMLQSLDHVWLDGIF